ncbi:MAG: tetratricopeptide repeat protein [Sciscionella sp.]
MSARGTGGEPPLRHYIDEETLHDVPDDPDALGHWLADRLDTEPPGDSAGEREYRTEVGVAARMLRRLDVAENQLRRALELAESVSPFAAVLARVRLAHVYQWQQREELAGTEFARCLELAERMPELGWRCSFVYQHAGKCAYDFGDWPRARELFELALRVRREYDDREYDDEELTASSELALDAADACVTATGVAAELHRLVPALHRAAAEGARPVFTTHGRPPHAGLLIDLGPLAAQPEIGMAVLNAIHRYATGLDTALRELVADGWLVPAGDTMRCTDRTRALVADLLAVQAETAGRIWPLAETALSVVDEVALAAVGTSASGVFEALLAVAPDEPPAGALLHRMTALRQHRAEAHARAWAIQGHSVSDLLALRPEEPVRRRIEAATDRRAAAAFRPSSTATRAELLAALRALPDTAPK